MSTIHITPDDSRDGSAVADATLRLPSTTTLLFQGFDLVGKTCFAAVASVSGEILSTPASITRYAATAKATLDADDPLLRSWAEDSPDDRVRIGVYTQADGWLFFADVRVVRLPVIPT